VRQIVGVLGILAVLSVLGAAATAVVHRPGPDASETWQWLRAYDVEVAVPSLRWRLAGESEAIGYGGAVRLRAPAVLDEGFCPSAESSSRAFVGLLPPTGGEVPAAVSKAAVTWAQAISERALGIAGTIRDRVDLDLPVRAGPCGPATVHLTVVGRRTPDGVVTLILVRDTGAPGDLLAPAGEQIVQSLRSRT